MPFTQEELRRQYEYNPETELWRWQNPHPNATKGWFAGIAHGQGYLKLRVNKEEIKADKLAWLYVHGEWPEKELDHIDRNPSNNKISNLRLANRSENNSNRGRRYDNTSGHTGIRLKTDKYRKFPWQAYIHKDGIRKEKFFSSKEEAVAWREQTAKELFGEFKPQ